MASGARPENFWGISCEKSRSYAKKSYFFPILGREVRAGCTPPWSAPVLWIQLNKLISNGRSSWQILDINPWYIWNPNFYLSWHFIFFVDWRIVVHTSRTCAEFNDKLSRYRRRCIYVFKHLCQIFTWYCAYIFLTGRLIELFFLYSFFKELFHIL